MINVVLDVDIRLSLEAPLVQRLCNISIRKGAEVGLLFLLVRGYSTKSIVVSHRARSLTSLTTLLIYFLFDLTGSRSSKPFLNGHRQPT